MKDSKKIQKKGGLIVVLAAIFAMLVIMTTVILYARFQYKNLVEQMGGVISNKTTSVSETVDMSIGYALNSIQVTSKAVSSKMTGKTIDNPSEILNEQITHTPFGAIEYIRADGVNFTDAGAPFNASEREYYIQGMQGKTGVWINYKPKYAKEPLLNFYTPLYYEDEIVGVLTGTVGGNSEITPMLSEEYSGQPIAGIVVDENNQIIASNMPFEVGMVLNEETANVEEAYKKTFFDAIDQADGSIAYLGGRYNNTLCAVSRVESTGWKVIQIAPSTSIHGIIEKTSRYANLAVAIVFAVGVLFFVILLIQNRRVSHYFLDEATSERDKQMSVIMSMSDVYYSMTLVDLVEDSIEEYASQGVVKEILGADGSATEKMHKIMDVTMTDEFKEYAFTFSDLSTLADRMQGKKYTYTDLRGNFVGWIRLAFIAIEIGEDERPTKIMCTTQVIEEEKQREQALIYRSNTDEMTGLLNRRSFEERLSIIGEHPTEEDFVYASLDVNGLKVVNDTLGHIAGDELLKGAAACMKRCFGAYGSVYRMGGDEFCAIFMANPQKLEEIKKDFEETVMKWSGTIVKSLAVSSGYVSKRECPELSMIEIEKLADDRMYAAKAAYYKEKGVDRRGQAAAHTALCNLYTKILKINLTTDSYQIVNMDSEEQNESRGYAETISEWLESFGKSGQVYEDDLAEYLEKTDLVFLQEYFKKGNSSLAVSYKRRIGDEFKQSVMEMILADDYTEDNQTLFLYVRAVSI